MITEEQKKAIENIISSKIGLTIEEIRNMDLIDLREYMRNKGKDLKDLVMEKSLSTSEINHIIDNMIRD